MRTPESGSETDAPFLQSDLVIVGQHYLAFLGPQDDTLLATNLQQDRVLVEFESLFTLFVRANVDVAGSQG